MDLQLQGKVVGFFIFAASMYMAFLVNSTALYNSLNKLNKVIELDLNIIYDYIEFNYF